MAGSEVANKTTIESAMALLIAGASFGDIARMLNFKDARAAKKAVELSLSSTVNLSEKEHLRALATARYEALLKSVMPRATNPRETNQLAYNQRAQSIIDRMVKMQGLDAPTQIQVSPSDDVLRSYVNQFSEALGLETDVPQEADILEEPGIGESGYDEE